MQHAPVALDEAQQAIVARFAGSWAHAGGSAEQEAANESAMKVVEQLNSFIQGMAEERLLKTVHIDSTLNIAEQDGILTIARSEQPAPFKAPADGRAFDMTTSDDEDGRGSLRINGETLVTLVETDQGGGERTYRIDDEGQMEITHRTFSPRLPADVVYTAHYAKP